MRTTTSYAFYCIIVMFFVFSNESWAQSIDATSSSNNLSIEITGPLTLKERIAVSRLLDSKALESYFPLESHKLKSGEKLNKAGAAQFQNHDSSLINIIETGIIKKQEYAVIDTKTSASLGLIDGATPEGWNSLGFALDKKALDDALKNNVLQKAVAGQNSVTERYTFDNVTSPKIDELNSRERKFGYSKTIVENPNSAGADAAQKFLSSSANVKINSNVPLYSKDINWLNDTIVNLGPEKLCQSKFSNGGDGPVEDPDWPFNVDTISLRLDNHKAIMNELGLKLLRPTKTLIIDSGLGEGVYNNQLVQIMAPSYSEMLFPSEYVNKNRTDNSETYCRHTELSPTEIFGYGFSPKNDHPPCVKTRLERLKPLEGHSEFQYSPDHGTFVGLLSAGGPDLVKNYEGLGARVQLDFAKVTKINQAGVVTVDFDDLAEAIQYSHEVEADVLNLSFEIKNTKQYKALSNVLNDFEGLVTAAAGNSNRVLDLDKNVFPAGLDEGIRDAKRLIVVTSIEKDGDGHIKLWNKSTHSIANVDIAAPGVRIRSVDRYGNEICSDGSSAAAPLVAFTAAMIRGTGLTSPVEIRRRILATADFKPELKGKVRDGRVLNIEKALDIFVDHIWLTENPETSIRGYLLRFNEDITEEQTQSFDGGAYLFCSSDILSGRQHPEEIDLNMLQHWQHKQPAAGIAEFWKREKKNMRSCRWDSGTELRFYNLETERVERISLNSAARIVPSPYRAAIKALYDKTLE